MGLAASQARLLTITSRKADCEFQSMTLSHQKLQLSRDLENISREYQDALNATRLVFGYNSGSDMTSDGSLTYNNYGTGAINLTYNSLMTPNAYNEYYPKTITDNQNRCILDYGLSQAARAAGIPAEGLGCTPSSDVRNKFIEALGQEGLITANQASQIVGTTYNYTVGLGQSKGITQNYTTIDTEGLLDLLGTCDSTAGYGLDTLGTYSRDDFDGDWETFHHNLGNERINLGGYTGGGASNQIVDITLSSLLSTDKEDQVVLSYNGWGDTPIVGVAALQDQLVGIGGNQATGKSFLDYLTDQFLKVLGGVQENEAAVAYAYESVYDMLCPNEDIWKLATTNKGHALLNGGDCDGDSKDIADDTKKGNVRKDITGSDLTFEQELDLVGVVVSKDYGEAYKKDWMSDIVETAGNAVGFASSSNGSHHHKMHQQTSININNVAQAFLTKMVEYLDGGAGMSEYRADQGYLSENNLFNIYKDDFTFNIAGAPTIDDGDSDYYSRFYDAMFNQICTKGWVENDQVNDYEYLTEMFKNGQAFISSISNDGYYYQGEYSALTFVSEITDTEKIAVAEAKYNAEKAKLENKEDTIDVKMKNLDTEISSLTTEYDTTKNLVTKAIEKTFKRYEA